MGGGENNSSNFEWIKRKIIRLIPLYYFALIIYGALEGGVSYWLGNEEHISIGNILAHVTFIHAFFPHYANSIIGVEWYLGVLVIFYVATPLLYRYIDSLEKSIIWFCFSGFICRILIFICSRYFVPGVEDSYIYSSFFGTFWFISQLPVIIIGIMLYHLLKSNFLERTKNKTLLSYALLLFSVCMIFGMALGYNKLLGLSEYTLFGIWFLLLIVSLKLNKCVLIDNKLFSLFGRYSYSIYLFHFFLIRFYEKYGMNLTQNSVANWGIKYFIIILLSVLVSTFFNKIIEEPMIRKLNSCLLNA